MKKTTLDQYEELVTDALKGCSANLRKSFKTAFIPIMILYMSQPGKINFTKMGRYSDSSDNGFAGCLNVSLSVGGSISSLFGCGLGKFRKSHCHRCGLHFKVGE